MNEPDTNNDLVQAVQAADLALLGALWDRIHHWEDMAAEYQKLANVKDAVERSGKLTASITLKKCAGDVIAVLNQYAERLKEAEESNKANMQ